MQEEEESGLVQIFSWQLGKIPLTKEEENFQLRENLEETDVWEWTNIKSFSVVSYPKDVEYTGGSELFLEEA